jgi:4-hydroxy-2-oxoglutarate aldolase
MFTGVNLLPDAVERLASHPNIVGMKESGNDLAQISEYIARTPDDFTVLAGAASTFFHSLCAGCDGAILAVAGVLPDRCVELFTLVRNGRLAEARALQRRIGPLARSVGSTYGVAGLKAALDLVGYVGGEPRPPLRPATAQVVEVVRGQLEALGVALARV